MDRIDAALARLEQAMERSAAQSRDLSQRHERLKVSVGAALVEIDTLIGQCDQ